MNKSKTIRLSDKQKEVIRLMREYPDEIIMYDYYLTGGHGIKLDGRSVESLKKLEIINTWGCNRLTELGKTINID